MKRIIRIAKITFLAAVVVVIMTLMVKGVLALGDMADRSSQLRWTYARTLVVSDSLRTSAYNLYSFAGTDTVLVVRYIPHFGRDIKLESIKFLPDQLSTGDNIDIRAYFWDGYSRREIETYHGNGVFLLSPDDAAKIACLTGPPRL